MNILEGILYFINLTGNKEVLWLVLPLFIATISMVIYFQKYREEWPGWNTLVANSLVLLFVGTVLIKYIYNLDGEGAINFINHSWKFIFSLFIIFLGGLIALLNFEHYFPKKIASWISSPLTVNLIAYVVLLRVYSDIKYNFEIVAALIIWFLVLVFAFHSIKKLFRRFFLHLRRLKEKEKKEEIVFDKKGIHKKKKEIKKVEDKTRKQKKEISKVEKDFNKKIIGELDKQKKEAIKLKKEINKPMNKKKRKSNKNNWGRK